VTPKILINILTATSLHNLKIRWYFEDPNTVHCTTTWHVCNQRECWSISR